MTDSEIDAAILAVTKSHWLKVARIIIDAEKRLGTFLEDGKSQPERVGKRVEALVDSGRLVAQGDVTNWRFSEVRLP